MPDSDKILVFACLQKECEKYYITSSIVLNVTIDNKNNEYNQDFSVTTYIICQLSLTFEKVNLKSSIQD